MASKNKAVSIYPELWLLKKIEAQAKQEKRKLGPMVVLILERWFETSGKKEL